jgi:hypothetical protein
MGRQGFNPNNGELQNGLSRLEEVKLEIQGLAYNSIWAKYEHNYLADDNTSVLMKSSDNISFENNKFIKLKRIDESIAQKWWNKSIYEYLIAINDIFAVNISYEEGEYLVSLPINKDISCNNTLWCNYENNRDISYREPTEKKIIPVKAPVGVLGFSFSDKHKAIRLKSLFEELIQLTKQNK